MAAASAAGYAAERLTVARWSSGPDRLRDEPQTIAGNEGWVRSADGTRLHVVETGDGPTTILAHGYTATSHYWAPVAARLVEAGCRVVAFDQRGHGRSEPGPGRFGADQLADDLAAVVAATATTSAAGANTSEVVVAGHSMGGIGIQAMVQAHPHLVRHLRGLVLVATLARPIPVPLGTLMGRLGGTALARKTMAHQVHGRVLARGGLGRQPTLTALDVVRNGWVSCPDTTRAGVMRDLRDFDFSETLRTLDEPTTVICGRLDRVTPLAESERMASLLPDARFVVVPGGGHALPWEAADRVAEAITDHTAGARPTPPTTTDGDQT